MQFTNRRTIGGHAWPSISLNSPEQEKALTLWANSSLGSLPVLDVTTLSKEALSNAVAVFADMKHRELRPINLRNDNYYYKTSRIQEIL